MEESVGRTFIVGATGFIGSYVTEACLNAGRKTYLLARPLSIDKPSLKRFEKMGAVILSGTITDQKQMETMLREHRIEYVISMVGGGSILDQIKLVKAIKAVGHVKRFLPSEFGHDIDRAEPVEPGLTMYKEKRRTRRFIEENGVPYTYICCNSVAAWPYHNNTHPSNVPPPLERFVIYGDGNVKAYFVAGTDIGKLTEMTLDDDRTLNKIVHFQPGTNILSLNEMAALWEKKIGRTLPRVTMSEDELLAAAREFDMPMNVVAAITHDIFIRGCQIYPLDNAGDIDVNSLYPNITFKTVDQCFDEFLMTRSISISEQSNENDVRSSRHEPLV